MAQGRFVRDAPEGFGAEKEAGNGGLHFGGRPEAGAGDVLDGADVVVTLEQDRQESVVFGGGNGRQAVGDFPLDGDDDPGRAAGDGREIDEEARGDGIGEVGHELHAGAGKKRRQVAIENIGVDQVEPGVSGEAIAEIGSQAVVFFHGGDGGGSFQQGAGEDAEAGADFENAVRGVKMGGIEKNAEDVAIDEKILAEDTRGMEIELGEERADLGGVCEIGMAVHLGIPFGALNCYLCGKVGAAMREAEKKIRDRAALAEECRCWRADGKRVVFTNGAFDLMHAGHATYLEFARRQGDVLVVALNTDASVRRYKGERRPIVDERNRARMMAALECVDAVTFFDEDEPRELIAELQPDVLVKAEDWAHYVSGREIVEGRGGRVVLAPMVEGLSTTKLIERIVKAYGGG